MTFWIIVIFLILADNIISNIVIAINNKTTLGNNKIKLKFKEMEERTKNEKAIQ
jgi:hypothetical protein